MSFCTVLHMTSEHKNVHTQNWNYKIALTKSHNIYPNNHCISINPNRPQNTNKNKTNNHPSRDRTRYGKSARTNPVILHLIESRNSRNTAEKVQLTLGHKSRSLSSSWYELFVIFVLLCGAPKQLVEYRCAHFSS